MTDPSVTDTDAKTDTDAEADGDAEANPDTEEAGLQAPAAPKNEQFANLNRLRRERTWVDVFLISGTCLHGQIRSFDASMLLLQTRSGDIGLYHHAISTVVRAQKRGGGAKPFKSRVESNTHIKEAPDLQVPARRTAERPPVVIVKQRRSRSLIKPE